MKDSNFKIGRRSLAALASEAQRGTRLSADRLLADAKRTTVEVAAFGSSV